MRLSALLEKKGGSNVSEATVQLLKSLNIPVTATTAIEKVESHPDYPSLYSISDSLSQWKVNNGAFHVETETLELLPTPFIAHLRRGGGQFVTVQQVNGTVEFVNEKGKKEQVSQQGFLDMWTQTVLLVEKSEASGESQYQQHRKGELLNGLRLPFLAGSALLLVLFYLLLFSAGPVAVGAGLMLAAKFAGIVVTALLLWFEIDKTNPLLQQLCTSGSNTDCTAVLSSKAAKVFNSLSWSEVGFFYFTGGFLLLLFTPHLQFQTFSLLAWANLFALPYTLFSVLYQWRIARQWCPLCLTVQGVLLLEFVVAGSWYWFEDSASSPLSAPLLFYAFLAFALPVIFWFGTKGSFYAAQTGKQYKRELHKLKYNREVFGALLEKQKGIGGSAAGLGLLLGDPQAKHTVVKVCNPYCGPCAKTHAIVDTLLQETDVKVQIIFTATNDEGDRRAAPVKHFLALAEAGDPETLQAALDSWYGAEKKDYAQFSAAYPVRKELLDVQGEKLECMDEWCTANGITFTPTLFLDGWQLPAVYKAEELRNFL